MHTNYKMSGLEVFQISDLETFQCTAMKLEQCAMCLNLCQLFVFYSYSAK